MLSIKSLYYNLSDQPEFQLTSADLPQDSGAVLVIRHSIRPPMHAGNFGVPLELTKEGIRVARKFGEFWENHIRKVSTSSSLRCIQTGNEIIRGAGLDLSVLHNPELGEPGAFISDSRLALGVFKKLGPLEIVNQLLRGVEIQGHRTAEEGVNLMLQSFLQELPKEGTIHIEITHDTILAVLLYFLQGLETIGEKVWPRMMEGALFWKKSGRIYWRWRGENRSWKMI